MIRLGALALAVWLPSATALVAEPAVTDECSICTARHNSLQALQSLRAKEKRAEVSAGAVPEQAERDAASGQAAGSDPCRSDPASSVCTARPLTPP